MIKTPTTFVIGAGAGVPYGYPTGEQLSRIIMGDENSFISGPVANRRMKKVASTIGPLVSQLSLKGTEFAALQTALRYASPLSIDALLMQREEFVDTGKLAIAAALLPFEQSDNAALFPMSGDWIGHLVHAMYGDGKGAPEKTVRIVTFNYDRLIEHRLTLALSALRGITLDQAWEAVQKIPLVHVYGPLGEYSPTPKEGAVCWSPTTESLSSPGRIVQAAQSIRLVHERGGGEDITPEVETARRFISESRRVWFLGFGFDATNVSRLSSSLAIGTQGFGEAVLGSAYGMTEGEVGLAKRAISLAFCGPTGTTRAGIPEMANLKLNRIDLRDADCLMALRLCASHLG